MSIGFSTSDTVIVGTGMTAFGRHQRLGAVTRLSG
jgi:hypothetical protein